jgi:Tol biopolymer transport system component
MTAFDRRLESELPDILTAIAAPRTPDYVDDALALTAATRQRPRWTFLERWLPMNVTAQRIAGPPSLPWRALAVAALLISLLAAGLMIAGAQRKVPPPFGPARNGALLFGDGDVFIRDSVNGPSRLLLGGPSQDFAASFTRDGQRLVFLRRTAGTAGSPDERIQLFTARADGTEAVALTGSLTSPDWWDLSPDDSLVVGSYGDYSVGQHLYRVNVKQPGEPEMIDLGRPVDTSFPNFRGPDGAEVLFRGVTEINFVGRSGVFAVHPDGTGFRAVTPTDGRRDYDYQFPQPSPDGKLLTYTTWDGRHQILRMHILDLVTGVDRLFIDDTMRSDGYATFSPDSTKIVFKAQVGFKIQMTVSDVADPSTMVPVGPAYTEMDGQYITAVFSPDGKWVIVNDPTSKETRLVDAMTGGEGTILDGASGDQSAWQRLAP